MAVSLVAVSAVAFGIWEAQGLVLSVQGGRGCWMAVSLVAVSAVALGSLVCFWTLPLVINTCTPHTFKVTSLVATLLKSGRTRVETRGCTCSTLNHSPVNSFQSVSSYSAGARCCLPRARR